MMRLLCLGTLLVVAASGLAVHDELFDFEMIVTRVNSLNTTWTAGHNFHPKTPINYFKRLTSVLKTNRQLPAKVYDDYSDIPESFDGRVKWSNCPSFRHIRDQGACGSCWAVAGASALSDRMCVFTNGSRTDELSAEEVLSCCYDCGSGCNGGYLPETWEYFNYHGLVSGGDYGSNEGCQPYSIQPCEHYTQGSRPQCTALEDQTSTPHCYEQVCTNEQFNTSFSKDLYRSGDVVKFQSVKNAQKSIMTDGSIEASFEVYSDFLTYKSGVYQATSDDYVGSHAIRIVGWGVENGTDYWLVANSWNTDWGDKGWFKIRRGVDECNIEDGMVAGDRPEEY